MSIGRAVSGGRVGCVGPDDLVRTHGSSETCDVCAGTTNDEAPFQPGDRVRWRNLVGTVLANRGDYGSVDVDGLGTFGWWWSDSRGPVRRLSQ